MSKAKHSEKVNNVDDYSQNANPYQHVRIDPGQNNRQNDK